MKFNYRKIASVFASAVMLTSTVGFAAAANYPAPFVVGGSPDAAIVVGDSANMLDTTAAEDLKTNLNAKVTKTTTTTTTPTGDGFRSLASGSKLMYLKDELNENIGTITDSDLKTVLADGTFEDDSSEEYDYQQTIVMGSSALNALRFTTSSGDLDDPAIVVDLSSSENTPMYTLTVTFSEAVPFNATDSKGQAINLFGKEYTVGTSTDGDTLVLLGGASETNVNVGEKVTVDVAGTSYELALNGISDASTPVASISLNGESKTFTEGQTKKVAGIDVYAKTVFRQGDNSGYVIIQLGSDKITIENGTNVMMGSSSAEVEGTKAIITGGVNAMTKLQFQIAAEDRDGNFIEEGKSHVDPIFGTVSLDFVSLKEGPTLEKEDDTSESRMEIKTIAAGERELQLSIPKDDDNSVTVPFTYQGDLQDDNSHDIEVVEGASLEEDEYTILNSGSYELLVQVSNLDLKTTTSSTLKSKLALKNLISGDTYNLESTTLNATTGTTDTLTILGQTFTVTCIDSTNVKVTSSDYGLTSGSKIAVYPYIEPIDGTEVKWAFTEEVTINNVLIGAILEVPSGTLTLATNTTVTDAAGNVTYTTTISPNGIVGANITITPFTEGNASILFMEEEDNSEADNSIYNAVLLGTTDDGTNSESKTPAFTSRFDSEAFDDSDFTGYLTTWGSFIVKDASDNEQTLTSLTFSENGEQMHAEIFVSEVGASLTPGSSGSSGLIAVFKDSQVSSFTNKNLIVVGGSCINTVALKIIDETATDPICGADFTLKTQVGAGKYLIKTVPSPYNADKIAVLVAGYEAADTTNAVGKLKEGASTAIGELIGPHGATIRQ